MNACEFKDSAMHLYEDLQEGQHISIGSPKTYKCIGGQRKVRQTVGKQKKGKGKRKLEKQEIAFLFFV